MWKREKKDKANPGVTIRNPGMPETERNRYIQFRCIYCGCDFTALENECFHYNYYRPGNSYDFVVHHHKCPNCGTECDAIWKIEKEISNE